MVYHHNVNALLTMRNVMKLIKTTVANLTMLIMMMIVLTIIHDDESSLMIPNAMIDTTMIPGPLEPPESSLPSLKITALSYSWTTWTHDNKIRKM